MLKELFFESQGDSFMRFRLSLLHSVSNLFFLYRFPSFLNCDILDKISDSIEIAPPPDNPSVCLVILILITSMLPVFRFSIFSVAQSNSGFLYELPYKIWTTFFIWFLLTSSPRLIFWVDTIYKYLLLSTAALSRIQEFNFFFTGCFFYDDDDGVDDYIHR